MSVVVSYMKTLPLNTEVFVIIYVCMYECMDVCMYVYAYKSWQYILNELKIVPMVNSKSLTSLAIIIYFYYNYNFLKDNSKEKCTQETYFN